MKIDEALLQNLAKWRPHSPRQVLELSLTQGDAAWKVALSAECVDALACKLWELRLAPAAPLPAVPENGLRERAERLAARATGLLEPLRLVEVDTARQTAQLRSDAPQLRQDSAFYYEVLLAADGAATARRYQAPRAAAGREQVAFALTHEALAKLVADLTA